jgi:hypothetical protein
MDEVVCWPAASCTSPSPASFSTADHYNPELDFVSSEVLERWLGSDDCLDDGAEWGDEDSRSAGHDDDQSAGSGPGQPLASAAPETKKRGRKPGPRTNGPVISHVEAERQRRDKLNRRFCELRAAVPTVTRTDKASLLADAATYIGELRDRVEQLEAEAKQAAAAAAVTCSTLAGTHSLTSFGGFQDEKLEVRMVGPEQEAAVLRLTTPTTASHAAHAPARFVLALRSLDLPVQHACVCRVGGVTVQDAVVDVPAAALRSERGLRVALLHSLQRSG